MATLQQANTYHEARRFGPWANFALNEPENAEALLQDAELYIRSTYSIRHELPENDQRTLDGIVCRLAGIFLSAPPTDAATASIKKQSSEFKGMKKELEFNVVGPDPYPYITVIARTLSTVSPGFSIGRMRRL